MNLGFESFRDFFGSLYLWSRIWVIALNVGCCCCSCWCSAVEASQGWSSAADHYKHRLVPVWTGWIQLSIALGECAPLACWNPLLLGQVCGDSQSVCGSAMSLISFLCAAFFFLELIVVVVVNGNPIPDLFLHFLIWKFLRILSERLQMLLECGSIKGWRLRMILLWGEMQSFSFRSISFSFFPCMNWLNKWCSIC